MKRRDDSVKQKRQISFLVSSAGHTNTNLPEQLNAETEKYENKQ